MDNQEEYAALSRADFIKLARESCSKNLSPVSRSNKESNLFRQKEYRGYENKSYGASNSGFDIPPVTIKLFLIRFICALMIFLTILIIDKLDLNHKTVNSEYFQECLASNQGIKDAEEAVASFISDFVKIEE